MLLTDRYVAFWRAVESEGAHPAVADVKKRIWQLRVELLGTIIDRAEREASSTTRSTARWSSTSTSAP